MKGFMQWFKSSTKMKRWIFLILIGILLACFGMAEVLVLKEITFKEVGKIVAIFVVGFLAIVFGLIFLNKITLEVLVESTDERMEKKSEVNVNSLIFNKKVYDKGPNIVVIGGGTGLNTVLTGLKKYTSNLTAIVTISDYGEEASISRKELGTKPLEDITGSIISLSNNEEEMSKLLNYKFLSGKLRGLNFSDIYFLGMKEVNNSFQDSIIKSNEILNIIGKVIPVTLDEMNITAELENGYIVTEKSKIPEICYEKVTKINRITLNPSNCKAAPGVIEAIKESVAIKVYVSNIMTEPGQTDNYGVAEHINAIIEHCGKGVIDYCIYDTGEIVPEIIKKYNIQGQDLVEQNIDKIKGIKFLQRNLSTVSDGFIRHDASLVASSIIELICDDLKYQDKQNDPQYLMLSNKLKEDKRIQKIKKRMENRENKKGKNSNKHEEKRRPKSKFSAKYSERIKSIKEADEKFNKKASQRKTKQASPKSKKSKTEIRNEMMKQLKNSKLKDD